MDGSLWRCTHLIHGGEECSVTVEQKDMEEHLRMNHSLNVERPAEVMSMFVLVRTALVPRGPGRRGAVDDQTPKMFEFHEKRYGD